MGNASFVQTSFLGGEWSGNAQGRMHDPAYKTAMNKCFNGYPTEEGSWIRRPGLRFSAHTKGGKEAKITAFDFTITQPYQIEFTDLVGRMFAGLSLVTTLVEDGVVTVDVVTNTNPAKVFLATAVPAGWADGSTIVFRQTAAPCSCPLLLNRQFVIANLDTTEHSFTLQDPITGADIDGASFDYIPVGGGNPSDTVEKVFEFTTVYSTAMLQSLRLVSDDTTALVLCPSKKPYLLVEGAPFTFSAQDFSDGPYLDLNKTTTTLTPSGTTGSITVAASASTGINRDQGFLTTDVGRLIRLRMGPAAWSGATTYDKDATATGSDGNIYVSIAGTNLNHNPVTDDGTQWVISSETVVWSWLKITARGSATSVTATIMGDDLPSTAATAAWRLGLYSDTTGWPSCGGYHEGRLWLASSAFGNRVDGSKSNYSFDFSPTASDGTVADDNAVAAVAKAKDVNYFFWMISTDDGLILGSQSGEWRLKASSLDDPISPTSVQLRRISNYGCANCEPVQASQNVFVQRQQRKLLAHQQVTDKKYSADNLSHLADHLISDGVQEIAWQQEPALTIWSRLTNGGLTGMVFQKDFENRADSFSAFFSVEFGDGRTAESISTGPTFDGLSTTLYVVTNQTDVNSPDYNVRWVQSLMPAFDASQKDWEAYFVDGGAHAAFGSRLSIANGDSFNGIRIFGLWNENGKTIVPVLGGLDLGDRVVANGYVDVPFSSDPGAVFTASFLSGLSDGTDYGVYKSVVSYTNTMTFATPGIIFFGSYTETGTPVPAYIGSYLAGSGNTLTSQWGFIQPVDTTATTGESLTGLVGPDNDVDGSYNGGRPDWQRRLFIMVNQNSGAITEGLRVLDLDTGNELREASTSTIFPGTVSMPVGMYHVHSNGFLYMSGRGGASNSATMTKIDLTTLTETAFYGTSSASFAGSTSGRLQLAFNSMAGPVVNGKNYLVFVGIRSAGLTNEVTLIDADGGMDFLAASQTDEAFASVCDGRTTTLFSSVFVKSNAHPSSWNSDPIGLYEYTVTSSSALVKRKIRTVSPTDIDATWSTFKQSGIVGPAYDITNNAVLLFFDTADVVTNKHYLVSFDAVTGTINWKLVMPVAALIGDMEMSVAKVYGHLDVFNTGGGVHSVYSIDTTAGTLTSQTWNSGFSASGFQFYGKSATPSSVQYDVPISVGATFTSRGQLLRPDFGVDAGAQNGPAFGKLRRIHKDAIALFRSRGVDLGTDFTKMYPIALRTPGKTVIPAPTLYSGIISDTIHCDYEFDAQMAWEATRPYPVIVLALGGYIASADK